MEELQILIRCNNLEKFKQFAKNIFWNRKRINDFIEIGIKENKAQFVSFLIRIDPNFPVADTLLLMEMATEYNNFEVFTLLLIYLMPKIINDQKMFIFEYLVHMTYKKPVFHQFLIRSCQPISQKYCTYKPRSIFSLFIFYILKNQERNIKHK